MDRVVIDGKNFITTGYDNDDESFVAVLRRGDCKIRKFFRTKYGKSYSEISPGDTILNISINDDDIGFLHVSLNVANDTIYSVDTDTLSFIEDAGDKYDSKYLAPIGIILALLLTKGMDLNHYMQGYDTIDIAQVET